MRLQLAVLPLTANRNPIDTPTNLENCPNIFQPQQQAAHHLSNKNYPNHANPKAK